MKRYAHRVTAIERLNLLLHEFYHYHADGVVEGVGQIDVARLQAAVERAAEANPAIRVRLCGWLGFSRWVDSGIAPRVRLLPQADWDGESERGAPFLKEKLDALRGGPVADVLVVPCRDGRTRLVFRTQHAAIDGRGCLHWVMDVCRVLRGEAPLGSASAQTDAQVRALHQARVVPEPKAPPVSCIPVVAPGDPGDAPLHYLWRRVRLDRNTGQLLPKTAAFLAEYARRREPGEIGFTIPVDYRGLRTRECGIGNLTGYVRLSVPEGAGPRALMQQIKRRVEHYADCRLPPGMNLLRWLPIALLRRRMRPKLKALLHTVNPDLPTGGLVSMGSMPVEAFCFPGFTAHCIVGIPGAVGKLNVVFAHDHDRVTACFTAPVAYNDRGQFDELVEAYRRHFSRAQGAS